MKSSIRNKIINALKESELVNKDNLKEFLKKIKAGKEEDILSVLLENDVISEKDLMTVLSTELGVTPIDLSRVRMDDQTMNLVPERLARKYNVVPISRVGDSLTLAVADNIP